MDWQSVATYAAIGINLGLAAMSAFMAWRHFAAYRRLRVAEHLLCRICVDAFAMQMKPVWQAWAQTMGDLSIEMKAAPREFD